MSRPKRAERSKASYYVPTQYTYNLLKFGIREYHPGEGFVEGLNRMTGQWDIVMSIGQMIADISLVNPVYHPQLKAIMELPAIKAYNRGEGPAATMRCM